MWFENGCPRIKLIASSCPVILAFLMPLSNFFLNSYENLSYTAYFPIIITLSKIMISRGPLGIPAINISRPNAPMLTPILDHISFYLTDSHWTSTTLECNYSLKTFHLRLVSLFWLLKPEKVRITCRERILSGDKLWRKVFKKSFDAPCLTSSWLRSSRAFNERS